MQKKLFIFFLLNLPCYVHSASPDAPPQPASLRERFAARCEPITTAIGTRCWPVCRPFYNAGAAVGKGCWFIGESCFNIYKCYRQEAYHMHNKRWIAHKLQYLTPETPNLNSALAALTVTALNTSPTQTTPKEVLKYTGALTFAEALKKAIPESVTLYTEPDSLPSTIVNDEIGRALVVHWPINKILATKYPPNTQPHSGVNQIRSIITNLQAAESESIEILKQFKNRDLHYTPAKTTAVTAFYRGIGTIANGNLSIPGICETLTYAAINAGLKWFITDRIERKSEKDKTGSIKQTFYDHDVHTLFIASTNELSNILVQAGILLALNYLRGSSQR